MGQDGGGHHDLRCGLRPAVGLCAERDTQGHSIGFADGIQWRVGHLGEPLREVFRNAAFLIGEGVDGRAIAHRGDLLLAGRQHRIHQELEAFLVQRVRHVPLVAVEVAVVSCRRALARGGNMGQVRDVHAGLRQHGGVVMARGKFFESLDGSVGTAFGVVVVAHAAGLDAASLDHRIGVEVDLPGLRHHSEVLGRLHGA